MSTVTKHLTRDMADGRRIIAQVEYREDDSRGLSDAFSATVAVYDPRGAVSGAQRHEAGAEMDSGGADDATILEAFPELAPVVALHLSNPRTGEPMHAAANAWYWYAGSRVDLRKSERYTGFDADMSYRARRDNPLTGDEIESQERMCYRSACSILRVDEIELAPYVDASEDQTPGEIKQAFMDFVHTQRERWQAEATAARELIDSIHDSASTSEPERVEIWTESYPHGLRIKSVWTGDTGQRDGVGTFYKYRVTIHAGAAAHRGSNKYTATFCGSVADYNAGRVDAREAGQRTLAELCEFLDRSANDMAAEFDMDMSSPRDREQFRAMERAETAANRLRDVLEPNRDLVGR